MATFLVYSLALGVMLPDSAKAETPAVESAPAVETGVSPDEAEAPPIIETEPLPVLAPVVVIGETETPVSGPSRLSQQEIERLPARNGSVNELLLVLPGIQASDSANLSTQAGEIAPTALSISGGKTYQNNFQLDGQGMNLILDPLNTTDPDSSVEIPMSSQGFSLNKNLIKQVTVLDHNVSAQYGGFAGGVVELITRDPDNYFGGDLLFRTTRDGWTRFHVKDEESFKSSNTRDQQPRFEKYEAGLTLDLPLTEKAGILAAYQRLESTIPLRHFAETKAERRQLENYFIKLVAYPGKEDRLEASLVSTPAHGDYFRADVQNSDYALDTHATMFSSSYRKKLGGVDLSVRGSYGVNTIDRTAPPLFMAWNPALSESKSWGSIVGTPYSNEGGFGDLTARQETLQFGSRLETTRDLGLFGSHSINSGIDYTKIDGEFRRPQTNYNYNVPLALAPGVTCAGDTLTCVEGEQYLSTRTVYLASDAKARINQYSAYLEDTITVQRLEIGPGVRIDWDDYMKNTDIAPRFLAKLDVFGDGMTQISGGANRYYSETLLAGTLREALVSTYREKRASVAAPWVKVPPTAITSSHYSDLDTPYVNEWACGIDQAFIGGRLGLDYIHRHGEDQFARKQETVKVGTVNYIDYELTNDGRYHYESQRLSWERSWNRHDLSVNVTRLKSRTNSESYLDLLEYTTTMDLDYVYYDGVLIAKQDLPRADYSQTWVGNLAYTGKLPAGFEFTNLTRYRSGYEVLKSTGAKWTDLDDPDKTVYAVYDEHQVPESWLFDWILTWRHALPRHQELALSLEVYNVFDRKVRAGIREDEYELGRQLWAGAEYRF